jgi:hypothetical protein
MSRKFNPILACEVGRTARIISVGLDVVQDFRKDLIMAEVDLEELYDSILEGNQAAISKTVSALLDLWNDDDFESVEIFAEETLTEDVPKKFISKILAQSDEHLEFVEDFVASIDGKPIVDKADFPILLEYTTSSRESDNEEFNASRSGRASVAMNPECPPELLLNLAKDEKWEIRYRVALNPASNSEVLSSLLNGVYPPMLEFLSEYLEATVALHKNTSSSTLEELANSENEVIRTAVACNPNTPSEIVQKAKSRGVNLDSISPSKKRLSQPAFRDTRLCWWFGDSEWTLADLENLQVQ